MRLRPSENFKTETLPTHRYQEQRQAKVRWANVQAIDDKFSQDLIHKND